MDELGKSFPVAEGFVEVEQGRKKKPVNENCLNCGTKLLDIYCHHCGQKDIPKRQTLRELIENFIGSFYSFESKFFRTVRFMLLKPGFLPVEYTAGRRESYYHPARAYVFISFVFFLLLFSLPDSKEENKPMTTEEKVKLDGNIAKMKNQFGKVGLDTLLIDSVYSKVEQAMDTTSQRQNQGEKLKGKNGGTKFTLTDSEYESVNEYDSIQNTLPESERDNWLKRKINIRSIEINNKYKDDDGGKRFGEDFGQAFLENFSKVLFYLLPIFALLLKLLYVRKDFYYSEHLVFSIYYYNFFYLASTLFLLVDYIPFVGGWVDAILVVWIIIYLPIAMKRMYLQSWGKTILKYILFFVAFSVFLTIGVSTSMLLIIMSM
ncbi:MAG: DUF3667 domain-containing protein [Cyclobacteriaceae bacterium]|nr:DUF3667 domain-containing protein [Cyclobacteriaceae bacterium]